MAMNFEVDGNIVDINGHPVDLSFFCSIIQRLASRVNLNKPEEFSIDAASVFPRTVFHADLGIDSYTNIPEKEIHIYLGLILVFCQLGNLEKALRSGFGTAFDELVKLYVKDISDDIRKILSYMKSLHEKKENNTIAFPKIDIQLTTYEIMVGYVYGHELSHYLDDIFDFDLRGKHQLEVFQYAVEYLSSFFKDTPYENYAVTRISHQWVESEVKKLREYNNHKGFSSFKS